MTAREVIANCARAELDHLPMPQCKALADDILAALSAAGLRVVPVEPTEAMVERAALAICASQNPDLPVSTGHGFHTMRDQHQDRQRLAACAAIRSYTAAQEDQR
jgi:hypothetical protein